MSTCSRSRAGGECGSTLAAMIDKINNERNEHILSEGEAHRHEVFVIQQGVVSLWSESNGAFELRDVRGPGDLLGVERFNGASSTLHSARAATDVVIYALPAGDIETLLEKYPDARQFVAAGAKRRFSALC